jgi:Fe-S cluster assembly protein SufB
MSSSVNTIQDLANREYKWGFVTNIEEERVPKGLNEDIIRLISAKKNEPQFMLDWRLKAYRYWASLEAKQAEPKWANVHYPPIDYQAITYYSAPKQKPQLESLDQLDPEILRTYEKLGIPLAEQKMLAGVARRSRRAVLLVLRGGAEVSRAGAEVAWLRCPLQR